VGRYLTGLEVSTTAEAREFLAIKETWNDATRLAQVRVPRGTVIWEGRAAAQSSDLIPGKIFEGGANQVFVKFENLSDCTFIDLRTLPAGK
jgi:hypothetical protein